MANENFNFSDIFGNLGKQPSIEDNFKKIAEAQELRAVKEENERLRAEIAKYKETIIRCPKCGAKLRMPKQ